MTTASSFRNLITVPQRGAHAFRHYFIPHDANEHHPPAFRPRALKASALLLLVVKFALAGFLYAIYPTNAQFAELTSARIFSLTNAAREADGLPALQYSAELANAAAAKAADMLAKNYFDHTAPDGTKFWQWIRGAGYAYVTAGENLAMDFTTAESVHAALMASPSHRANILKASYTDIGLAVVHGKLLGHETTILVETFGMPSTQAQPSTAPAPAVLGTTDARPAYAASLVGTNEEHYFLLPGASTFVWADFRNTGSEDWTNDGTHYLALNVADPAGRTSVFEAQQWVTSYRPAILDDERVAPDETGRFAFWLKAPLTPGEYRETFALVAEQLTWLEGGTVTMNISVSASAAPSSDSEAQQTALAGASAVARAGSSTVAADAGETSDPLTVTVPGSAPDWQRVIVDWSVRFFWAFTIFFGTSLLFALAVRVHERRPILVARMAALFLLAASLAVVRFHFVERIAVPLLT